MHFSGLNFQNSKHLSFIKLEVATRLTFSTYLLTKRQIQLIFVAFSENLNFTNQKLREQNYHQEYT